MKKPIPQRWLDSGCMTFGPGYWEMWAEETEPHDVLERIPGGHGDRDGRAGVVGVLPDRREGER